MIWLAWRQFRTQAAVVFGALLVLAVLVVVTGLRLRSIYHDGGIAQCAATTPGCDTVRSAFAGSYSWIQTLLERLLLLVLPAATGAFWGAPLVAREFDTGTFRLAWTQSVTRTTWLSAKILVVGGASVLASAFLSLLTTWWFEPLDAVSANRLQAMTFQVRDIVPAAYAAFAFALGLTAGLVIRRTLAAMAVTIIGYIAVRVAVMLWVRPRFANPIVATMPMGPGAPDAIRSGDAGPPPGSWITSVKIIDPNGHVTGGVFRISADDPCVQTRSCLNGYTQRITYYPPSHYWPFQWLEAATFLLLAALLLAFSYWWLAGRPLGRRRRAAAGSNGAATPDAPREASPAADDRRVAGRIGDQRALHSAGDVVDDDFGGA